MASPVERSPGEGVPIGRHLAALTLAALAVRAAFLLLEPATHLVGDERTWTDSALIVASPRVCFSPLRNRLVFYPPVYAYFLAGFYAVTGSFEAAKWAQAGLSVLLVPAVGRAGARAFSPRVGAWAAAVTAFYPELVWFSVHFWSETLFLVLLWWGFERLLAADESGAAMAAAAGLLWGLATLTRETALYFIPVAAVWLARNRGRRGLGRAAAFALAALLVIAPWTYRNWVLWHTFVPVSTAGGQNLFQGNALIERDTTYDMVHAVQGKIEQYRYARHMGLEAIRARQPWWIFEKLRDEMPRFWEADSLVLVHIKRGAYAAVPPAVAVAVAVVVLVPYLAVLGLFALGLASLRGTRPEWLLGLFFAYYNLLHVVTHGFARYRLPILPLVFLVAGVGWVPARDGALRVLPARRRAVAATAALLLGLILVPSFRLNWEHPAFGLRDTGGPPAEDAPPSP